jgi:transcription factor HY5
MQAPPYMDKPPLDGSGKHGHLEGLTVPGTPVPIVSTADGFLPNSLGQVPQLADAARQRLTAAQHSELEMARRRAEKAAEGKRANAMAAKQRLKQKKRERGELQDEQLEAKQREIERKVNAIEDEKEAKRLKRLLRNRVSAQQARERKKSYVANIEDKCTEQEQQIAQLQQRVKTLERETTMLRQVIKNIKGNQNLAEGVVPQASPFAEAASFGEDSR